MLAKSIVGPGLVALLVGCTTTEEQAAAQIDNLFADGEADFGQMCGTVAELLLENNREMQYDNVQARIANTKTVRETDSFIDVLARIKVSASGYYSGGIDVECRFDQQPAGDSLWHDLQALRFAGSRIDEAGIEQVNALGRLMATTQNGVES